MYMYKYTPFSSFRFLIVLLINYNFKIRKNENVYNINVKY